VDTKEDVAVEADDLDGDGEESIEDETHATDIDSNCSLIDEDDEEEDEVKQSIIPAAVQATLVDLGMRKKSLSMFVVAKKRFSKRAAAEGRIHLDYEPHEVLCRV
jgi:hypothetical protein